MAFEREKELLRQEICHAARQIAQAGYVAANDGNLSARCPDGHILWFIRPGDTSVNSGVPG